VLVEKRSDLLKNHPGVGADACRSREPGTRAGGGKIGVYYRAGVSGTVMRYRAQGARWRLLGNRPGAAEGK